MNSCYYDELQVRPIPELPTDPDNPDFVEIKLGADIQPIFTADCISCHNASRNPDLREGFAYAALVPAYVTPNDPDASLLLTKLIDGHRSVNTTDLALIKTWINQGAKNN